MKDLIEKLKDNKVGWLFLNKEERECLKQANLKAAVDNLKFSGEWEGSSKGWDLSGPGANEVFRIKPYYQPESEYVDLEIVSRACSDIGASGAQWLGVLSSASFLPWNFTHLHCLPSLPNFECFWKNNPHEEIYVDIVARNIRNNYKVYARFRA